jgi:hypothetical protein
MQQRRLRRNVAKIDEGSLLHDLPMTVRRIARTPSSAVLLLALSFVHGCGGGGGDADAGVWAAPACISVSGASSITYTSNEGANLAPRTLVNPSGVAVRVSGLIALPAVADRMLGVYSTGNGAGGALVLVSRDAGCTWDVGKLQLSGVAELVPTQFDVAYGWSNLTQGNFFYKVRSDGTGIGQSVDARTYAVVASPSDARFVWRLDNFGRLFKSTDSGKTWLSRSQVPFTSFGETVTYAVIDDLDPAHIVVGSDSEAWVTFDEGTTWTKSIGLTTLTGVVNVGNLALAPTNHAIVWASGLDITENTANPPKGYRLWRSTDGGLSFTTVFDRSDATSPTVFGRLVPHPTDTNVVYWHVEDPAFGTVALYKFDLATGLVTAIDPPGIHGIRSMVFHPTLPTYMYFGLYWPG